jgi:hypothetical protein
MFSKRALRFIFEVAMFLGSVACILTWLGIKPGDLAMTQSVTIPHALWLLLAIVLFVLGIGSSVWTGFVQRKEINGLKTALQTNSVRPVPSSKLTVSLAEYKAINGEGEVRNVTEAVKGHVDGIGLAFKIVNSELGLKDSDDLNFGERKRLTVNYSFDGGPEMTVRRWERDMLTLPVDPQLQALDDLQVKAIRISLGSLAMLEEIGPKPTPRYTEVEIDTMSENQRLALIQSNDKDFADACDYYFGGSNVVVREETENESRLAKRVATRYNFHRPWEVKTKNKFEARFGEDLAHLRKALATSEMAARLPAAILEEWNVEKQIQEIAKQLWLVAFDLGNLKTNEDS